MGILTFILIRAHTVTQATAVGRCGRAPEGIRSLRYVQPLLVYPSWGRVSTVGLKAGLLSAPGPLHWVPPVSRMLPFGLRLFLFSLEPLH